MEGWIKLHRKIFNWRYFKNSEVFHVFSTLLLLANHKEGFTKDGTKILPGQLMTSRKALSEITGLDESKVFRIMKKLEIEQQIEQRSSTKNTIVTVTNFKEYQFAEQVIEQQVNSDRTASEQQVNTNKNDNNNNNEKNDKNSLLVANCFTSGFFEGVIDAPKKNLPEKNSKAKRKGLTSSPLSCLFPQDDSIQAWLLTGSEEAQKTLLEKYSHHVLAEEIKKAFIWQSENKKRDAGLFLVNWMSNKKTSAYGANQGQTTFKNKPKGVMATPQNPTGNPYIQEAIDKGLIA